MYSVSLEGALANAVAFREFAATELRPALYHLWLVAAADCDALAYAIRAGVVAEGRYRHNGRYSAFLCELLTGNLKPLSDGEV